MSPVSPAIVAQKSVAQLPRWALLLLCLAYVVPGFVGRQPWKNADIEAFGFMLSLARPQDSGSVSWLKPMLAGQLEPSLSLLHTWLGAAAIRLAPMGWEASAARLPFMAMLVLTLLATWRGVFALARTRAAQPVAFAFGGEARPLDYARTLADGALLIYLACLGLLLRSHETATPALHVSLVAAAFYAAACLFDRPTARAAIGLGTTLGLLVLARGWTVPLALLIAMFALAVAIYREALRDLFRFTLSISILIPLAWLLAHRMLLPGAEVADVWLNTNLHMLSWPRLVTLGFLAKTLVWYSWPAWPIAAWAVWAWRSQATLHVMLTVAGVTALLLLNLFTQSPKDHELLSLLPPLIASSLSA